MPQPPKIRPPFAWLGQHTEKVALIMTVVIGAVFRFLHLASIPPGLYNTTATIGLQALALIHHGRWPGFNAGSNYAPLWVVLQALPVKLLGPTLLALRLWPAVLGTLAVATTWLWARAWFGLRVAWMSALLMAVTPWAVTLTRDGSSVALVPFLVTLTLWLATLLWHRPHLGQSVALALALLLDLLAGPLGWTIAVTVATMGLVQGLKEHKLKLKNRAYATLAVILAAGIAVCGALAATSHQALRQLPQALGLVANPMTLGANLLKVLVMLNVSGDQNFRHNLAGEPMLNAFVGLALVAGLLVGISRLHERRYRLLFAILGATLIPAVVSTTGVPNAAHAAALMPGILVLAAIGASYLLELWYATFPINSAARTAGQAAILVLLALTVFQGYTQYFRAWAASAEVYAAYDEDAVAMAVYLKTTPFNGARYVVAPAEQVPVVAYLDYGRAPWKTATPAAITSLPATGTQEFLIAAASKSAATKTLQAKFPGHTLQPEYSTFNQMQIYYLYDTSK